MIPKNTDKQVSSLRLDAAPCSLFFDLPLVKVMRKYFYADAFTDLGEEAVTNLIRKGYVVVPWAEHAQMFLTSEHSLGDPLRQLHESSMNGASISNLNVSAQVRYYVEGHPIPDALSSGPLWPDALKDDQDTTQCDGHQTSECSPSYHDPSQTSQQSL